MLNQPQKLRVNGQLVETSDEETRNLSKKAGLPATPVTPQGAAALGASPDAVKMVGSRQQVQASPKSLQTDTKQTLQGAERLQGARTQATDAEKAQAQKAGKLQQLSSIDQGVQGLVNQQLAKLSAHATGTAFNAAQLGTLAPTVSQDDVKSLLTKYHDLNLQLQGTGGSDPAVQSQLAAVQAQLTNQYGINNPQDYLDNSNAQVGAAAAQQVINPADVTLGKMDLSSLGMNEADLTTALGPDWQNLTVGQFQQRVQDLRQAEFQRINTLRAKLATLPAGSSQREMILRDLGDEAAVGVTGVEQGVKNLQTQIASADQVSIGGTKMSVNDLLKDDNVSRLVADYLNPAGDPDAKAALERENPEFVTWIHKNADALTALSKQMGVSDAGFGDIQDQQHALGTVADGVTLNDKAMEAITGVKAGQAVSSVSDVSGSSVYGAIKSAPKEDQSSLVDKINSDPSQIDALKDLTADQVLAASQTSDRVSGNAALAQLLGYPDASKVPGFMTDPAKVAEVTRLAPLVEKLQAAGPAFQTDLTDPVFQDMLKSGVVNDKNLDALIKNPKVFEQYKAYQDTLSGFADLEKSKDPDDTLAYLFDSPGLTEKSLEDLFVTLKSAVDIDPLDTKDAARLTALSQVLGPDGKLDAKEEQSLLDRIGKTMGSGALDDLLAGKRPDTATKSLKKQLSQSVTPTDAHTDENRLSFQTQVRALLGPDGKITNEDLDKLDDDPDFRESLWAMPEKWRRKYGVPNRYVYQRHVDDGIRNDATNTAMSTIHSMGVDDSLIPYGGDKPEDADHLLAAFQELDNEARGATGPAKEALTTLADRVHAALANTYGNINNAKNAEAAATRKRQRDAWIAYYGNSRPVPEAYRD